MREHGPVCTRGQKTREGAASAVRNRHDHRHLGQLLETQQLFDTDKRPGEKCGLGRAWLQAAETPVLRVPSAIVPPEWNYILNLLHEAFANLTVLPPDPFEIDVRLFGRSGRRAR